MNNTNITEAIIPESVTDISFWAFYGCTALKSAALPDSVTKIGESAFYGCWELKSIIIPKSLVTLEKRAFTNTGIETPLLSLDGKELYFVPMYATEYTVPSGVTKISPGAFLYLDKLTYVSLPYGLTEIGDNAFSDCSSLKSISIPPTVRSVGKYAFFRCMSLTELYIPAGVSAVGEYAFSDCSGLKSVTIACNISAVSNGMFGSCPMLTSITLPKSLTSIGEWAFFDSLSLASITIQDGVNSIGEYAFASCEGLTEISIPGSVASIGANAFDRRSLVTISGAKGSCAEDFAVKNSIAFNPITKSAAPTGSVMTVNGKAVKFEAYNIDGSNYFKLRDLAMALSGTGKQFNVIWEPSLKAIDLISGKAYAPTGGELAVTEGVQSADAVSSVPLVRLDGKQIALNAYEIGDCNCVKLRDLAAILDFGVTYDGASDSIAINTDKGYQP